MGFLDRFRRALETAAMLVPIAEAAVPEAGKGIQKGEFLLAAAGEIFKSTEEIRDGWKNQEAFTQAVGKAAVLVVALKNAAGVFKTTTPKKK